MNYPTLNLKTVGPILQLIEAAMDDPSILNPENCPYDPNTVRLIQRVTEKATPAAELEGSVHPGRGKVGRPTKGPTIPVDEIEREVDEIRKELASLKIDGQAMETSDRIQVIKTRAALIERVIGMKERTADIKRFHSFLSTVIGIMEDHLEPKDRDKVMKELEQYVEK